MRYHLWIAALLIFFLHAPLVFSQSNPLYINEFLASNTSDLQDEDDENSDWIEIYNSSDSSINLEGYILTDDQDNAGQWEFPAISIGADEYLLIFASGKDKTDSGSELHTNFNLDRDGEFIGLYDNNGTIVDTLVFQEQTPDTSYGRDPVDTSTWLFFGTPTPGSVNPESGFEYAELPRHSITGGFYSGSQSITLSTNDPDDTIYYTLDGSTPTNTSTLYTSSFEISSTTPVRAFSTGEGKVASEVTTHTYFIDEEVNLPFVSLVTDPDNFFSDESGIYVTGTNGAPGRCQQEPPRNLNQDWERPVNLEYFETDGSVELNQGAGVKIFGGCSRTRYPQKSLAIYARSQYGNGDFDYRFFDDKEIDSFEAFLLRSSADDQVYTMFKDAYAQYVQVGYMDIDYMAYQPVVVFINGEYWGIHNLREKLNEHFIADNHSVDPDQVNILEDDAHTVEGSSESYKSLINFVENNNLNNADNYEHVKSEMDVDQYIDYQIANIYMSEVDWPGNNIKFWKANTPGNNRWRWLMYDRDQTFMGHRIYTNTLELATFEDPDGPGDWPNPDWSTNLLRQLLTSYTFKNQFIQTYAYHLNTTFVPERLIDLADEFESGIAPEIPRHIDRWGGQRDPYFDEPGWETKPTFATIQEWEAHVDTIRIFSTERPPVATSHIESHFDLDGMAELTVSPNMESAGTVSLFGFRLDEENSVGDYFKSVPLTLNAIPALGYEFSHWTATVSDEETTYQSQTLELTLTEDTEITAVFQEQESIEGPPIIINEINYNSPDDNDAGDWLELYNRNTSPVDLSGWILKDSNDDNEFIIPQGTVMQPEDFIVLYHDGVDFGTVFPDVPDAYGNVEFNFSNGGELIRLYDEDGSLIDQVGYDDEGEWPAEADGNGSTLELKDYDLDNDLASSWGASNGNGTPGEPNSISVSNENEAAGESPEEFTLYQNYPNPFNPETTIEYYLQDPGQVQLEVFDLLGQKVATLVNSKQGSGHHQARFDASHLATGVYIYRLTSHNKSLINKMTLIK